MSPILLCRQLSSEFLISVLSSQFRNLTKWMTIMSSSMHLRYKLFFNLTGIVCFFWCLSEMFSYAFEMRWFWFLLPQTPRIGAVSTLVTSSPASQISLTSLPSMRLSCLSLVLNLLLFQGEIQFHFESLFNHICLFLREDFCDRVGQTAGQKLFQYLAYLSQNNPGDQNLRWDDDPVLRASCEWN